MGLRAKIEDLFLSCIAAPTSAPEIGGTVRYTLDNCLHFAHKCIPDFDDRIRCRCVLDYGCGFGWQAVAMATQSGAEQVIALDIVTSHFDVGRELAERSGCSHRVLFCDRVPEDARVDVVVSLSAFEHFGDPAGELRRMSSLVCPGGLILLAFAEPWYSPNGSHVNGYTRFPFTQEAFPWLNLLVSDRALLKLRSRYRPDHPERLENISGGLNKMTLGRFEKILEQSELIVESRTYFGMKGLDVLTRLPVIRELATSAVGCVLRRPAPLTDHAMPAQRSGLDGGRRAQA